MGGGPAAGPLSVDEVRGLTDGRVPTLAEALAATEGSRVMVDLPGPADQRAVRRIVDAIREYGATDRVYYCAGADAMLAVRAADASAEIALTWTSLAPPRPAVLDAVRPRWLNYRFTLVDRDLTAHIHREGYLLSVWTPDTRRSMRLSSSTWASTRSPPTASTCCAGSGRRAEGSVVPPRQPLGGAMD